MYNECRVSTEPKVTALTQTNDARWVRMFDYLRRARSSPAFDWKERAYRLEVAKDLRRILQLASEGEPWLDQLPVVR